MNRDISNIAQAIQNKAKNADRVIVAVAGPPGAGKSTFAEALTGKLRAQGERAVTVPMDGFHYDNAILDAEGIRPRKGAPFTFDAAGFLSLLKRLRAGEDRVAIPAFDRRRDISINCAWLAGIDDRILVVEGNYLLLDEEPWSQMLPLFDLTVFLNPGMETLKRRLIDRWLGHDHTREQAERRAMENDIPNAQYVLDNSADADIVLTREG
ncbi:nucleoside triphosphate hydrolase [Oricola cellulosilytica]|uniref:Nucleoside triphosphate hydrolase n=1 Tax=Oricola cellulosilytica TaxID=1429082 RepID=A0A4R0PC83_9HYPH|nr:nucleoside triphosphate hydrolase [Oricola cellulosilytica]TCD14876.1 nucleoside triphosphate hydrolase [Oricola cellulosilytica]